MIKLENEKKKKGLPNSEHHQRDLKNEKTPLFQEQKALFQKTKVIF